LKYLVDELYNSGVEFDKSLVVGVMIPVVLFTVWFSIRRIHHHFIHLADKQGNQS